VLAGEDPVPEFILDGSFTDAFSLECISDGPLGFVALKSVELVGVDELTVAGIGDGLTSDHRFNR